MSLDPIDEPAHDEPGRPRGKPVSHFAGKHGGAPDAARGLADSVTSISPGRFARLLGDEIWQTPGAAEAAVRPANATDAAVFGRSLWAGCVFPSVHNAWSGQRSLTARRQYVLRLSILT